VGVDDRNPKQRSQRLVLQHRRRGKVDRRRFRGDGRLCLPCELGDEEWGKYMDKVRTDMVQVKQEKQSNNKWGIAADHSNKLLNPAPNKSAEPNEWKVKGKKGVAYQLLHPKPIGFSHECMTV